MSQSSGRIPGKPRFAEIRQFEAYVEACSLFILEKGKPVARPGRKAVDHGAVKKRRGSLATEGMTVCCARRGSDG